MPDRLCWHFDSSSSSLSLGWHEDTDKKMSQSSLAQDQAKLGSKNTLNRRVTAIQVKFVKKKVLHVIFWWDLQTHISGWFPNFRFVS